ncbi:MAG: peptidoglycan-binding protein [Symploca sp. SIO2E9]|nr:peptidoglycan-binding protein [Symploca sp. SIO2E9]
MGYVTQDEELKFVEHLLVKNADSVKDSDGEEHPHGVWIHYLKAHKIYTTQIDSDYLNKLVKAKVKRIYLKVFDGKYNGQLNPTFWHWQCSLEIIQSFKSKGIQVYGWGYHYGSADVDEQVAKVKKALDCGLDGYVVDVEEEVKQTNTHFHVDKLLSALRSLLKKGTLGYTSFGNPRNHPNVPWQVLDKYCDLAFPQIYFEKWRRKSTPEEVKDCLDAHKHLGLTKPILPIWGSEDDTVTKYGYTPASASELQDYLDNYPGSSLWRIPHQKELGEAWNLIYSGFELPTLTEILRLDSQGKDVKALQKVLNARGFNAGTVDGDFGKKTQAAVKAFQTEANLYVDGEVGSQTWKALGGKFDQAAPQPVGDGQRIIDAVEKVNPDQDYYLPRDIDEKLGKETFCNWFVADVLDQLEVPLRRYGRSAGSYDTPHPIYGNNPPNKPFSAEHLYDYFMEDSGDKWQEVKAPEAVTRTKKGQVVLASVKGKPGGSGHIAIVLPKGSADDIRIAQAGKINGKDIALKKGFGSFTNVVKFFTYIG